MCQLNDLKLVSDLRFRPEIDRGIRSIFPLRDKVGRLQAVGLGEKGHGSCA